MPKFAAITWGIVLYSAPAFQLQQKSSRSKGALIGELAGLGMGFPIGAFAAGYIRDRNHPAFGHRAGMVSLWERSAPAFGDPIGALAGVTNRRAGDESANLI